MIHLLINIASLCPYLHGNAIFQARALMLAYAEASIIMTVATSVKVIESPVH